MSRFGRVVAFLGGLALLVACAPAYADRVVAPPGAAQVAVAAPEPVQSPYTVELLGMDGRSLTTYEASGRHYVLGAEGQRYVVRVSNPTDRRVEAVISIDGLDAIDGQAADFVRKRGYVVPPRGELRVEGFRVSTSHVATFRFSSVGESYAGRKGVDRNVGVIGVALFEEKAAPAIVVDERPPPPHHRPHPHSRDRSEREAPRGGSTGTHDSREASAEDAPAPPPRSRSRKAPPSANQGTGSVAPDVDACCTKTKNDRPGLGTEYGEQRYSAVSWTRFERANSTTPTAVATLRYNDRAGLAALGIPVEPEPSPEELITRETANPFPDSGFAEPPPR
jgi:hypothetical protein